jgi:hypothetical protein
MLSLEDPGQLEDDTLTRARDLLASVLSTPDERGTLFGGYVLHEKLGRGGFGIVFRARQIGHDEAVALKQMRGGAHATPEERREFLTGAEAAARLEHAGIVKIREVGEIDDCPFFTMDLVAGVNLAATIELGQPSQAQAARWLRSIALAVDHAHSRAVLHRDLKPANILLDQRDEPVVVDFGSARRLSNQGQCVESGEGVLSYYMAPEQATGDARGLTRRADIYSLGVILYELLTGRVPYEGLPFADWVAELVSRDPVRPPRELEPNLNRDLELVCLKCVEKDPDRRYVSAALLAEDLDCVLRDRPLLHARPERAPARVLRWVRRYPLRSAVACGAVLFGLVLFASVFSLLQTEKEQQRAALETNAFIANSQAGALLFQLREFAERAERCAQKPTIRALLVADAVNEDPTELEACARGFQSVYVAAPDGRLLARWPRLAKGVLGKNYAFRGYFRGARELAARALPGAYLGPAYRAESNGQLEFAFAVPVMGSEGEWLGSVVAAQGVDSAIGQVRMQDSSESGRIVALLGPRDVDRTSSAARSSDFDFIVHPQLGHGREVALQDPSRAMLERAFGGVVTPGEQFSLRWAPPLLLSDYHDPLLDPARSSLAAFAPVGRTGYLVAVQISKDAVRHEGRALALRLAWRAGVPLAAALLLLGLGLLSSLYRRRRLETRPRRLGRPQQANSGE